MNKLAEISEFNREKQIVVLETENGKVRLSFDEWKWFADAYAVYMRTQ